MDDLPRAAHGEVIRIRNYQDEITKIKCTEPMAEFNVAETHYLKAYGLSFKPSRKYDVLTSISKNKTQIDDANQLKIIENLAIKSCKDAKAENLKINPAGNLDYLKANWKVMVFNVK